MIRLLVLLSLLGFGSFASANTPEPLEQVISLEQFSTLTKEQKTIYLRGLQNLLVDLNQQEAPAQGVENTRLRQLLLPTAFAEVVNGNTVGGPCIFAGNVLTFAANGLCPRPPQGSCLSGQIQCNALVFGDGVCTAPNSRATYNCMQSARPVSEIIAYAESHKGDWQKLSNTLGSYCAETGTQGLPCRLVQGRLNEMRKVADIPDTPAPVAPPKVADKPEKPTAVPLPKPRPPQADRVVKAEPPRPPADIPPPPLAPKPPAPPAAVPKFVNKEPVSGKVAVACDVNKLFDAVRCKYDPTTGAESLNSLMFYDEAYQSFCETRKVSKEFDATVRKNLEMAKKCVTTTMQTSKDPLAKQNGNYYLRQLNEVLWPNYEKCVADLKSKALPASKNIGDLVIESRTATNGREYPWAIAKVKGKTPEDLGHAFRLSKVLSDKGYNFCDMKMVKVVAKTPAAKAKTAQ